MKSTEIFKQTIQTYLEQQAANDELFAVSFRKPDKTINQCITYILNEVKRSGCNGFADSEIFALSKHYYDEDNIEIGSPIDCQIAINHTVELTAEEKEEARQKAIQKVQDEAYNRLKQPSRKPQAKQATSNNQLNLFEL